MDELINIEPSEEQIKKDLPASVPEIYLGTVYGWNASGGILIKFDGQTEPTTKRYKMLNVSHAPKAGDRVLVLKLSGTYIVLGDIALPQPYYSFADLPNDATLATVIMRVNSISAMLRSVGILWPPANS